jgi:uncharacterized protein (DUF2062 family)
MTAEDHHSSSEELPKSPRKRLSENVRQALKRGVSKKKIVLSVAIGFIGGIFPVLGTTTILCTILALIGRANWAITQLVNWLVYPLQLIFILPFMRFGVLIFSGDQYEGSLQEISEAFSNGFIIGLKHFGIVYLHAVLLWCVIALPVFILILFLSNLLYDNIHSLLKKFVISGSK